jgi:hypothetical protein
MFTMLAFLSSMTDVEAVSVADLSTLTTFWIVVGLLALGRTRITRWDRYLLCYRGGGRGPQLHAAPVDLIWSFLAAIVAPYSVE